MNKWKYYFKSFRFRTLPLSLSGVIAGAMIAGSTYVGYSEHVGNSEFSYNSRQNIGTFTFTRIQQGINPQRGSIRQESQRISDSFFTSWQEMQQIIDSLFPGSQQIIDSLTQESQRQRDSIQQESQRQRDSIQQESQRQRESIQQESQRQRESIQQESQRQRESIQQGSQRKRDSIQRESQRQRDSIQQESQRQRESIQQESQRQRDSIQQERRQIIDSLFPGREQIIDSLWQERLQKIDTMYSAVTVQQGDGGYVTTTVEITPIEEAPSGFYFGVETSSGRSDRTFNVGVFIFAILTTLCLQILSNLSNDYGDMKRGTDNEDRLGPQRSLQMGELTMEDMKRGIIVFALLSALFGYILVCIALGSNYHPWGIIFMLLIGALAIIGAVKYTVGKGAYGYYGLGDLGVLVFFGLVSTVCTYYLMCEGVFREAYILLPAFSIGLFSVGVLNLNNMRDIENDAKFGKRTLPVRFGEEWAKKYHRILIYVGLLCAFIFAILCRNHGRSFLFLLTVPFFLVHLRRVRNASGAELDSELRYLSLTTFVFAFLIGLGQLL